MTSRAGRLPSRKWSIVALASGGLATVLFSYLLLIALAVGFLMLPYALFMLGWDAKGEFIFWRLLGSTFGVVVGFTILSSLFSRSKPNDPNGVRLDLEQQPRLAEEIGAISARFNEPMPSEVYLTADANAFVVELPRTKGSGKRRILGVGLPLLQMLTIGEFRAVLAHEFGHYYGGDTRLGPAVYSARRSVEEVYKNLGKKSEALTFLRRWRAIAGLHRALMAGLRLYWLAFMQVSQAISRRQELRCDELACWTAGSQALIDGLGGIRKCGAVVNAYWHIFVVPVAAGGYRPDLANGFQHYMQMPGIAKATADHLAQQMSITKAGKFDSHPPLSERIGQARRLNLPAWETSLLEAELHAPMISLISQVESLEDALVRSVMIGLPADDWKPLNWETAGSDIYIPAWRRRIAPFALFLGTKKIEDLPMLALDPGPLARLAANPPGAQLTQAQRAAIAHDILYSAFAVCLLDNGWELATGPGKLVLVKGDKTVDPNVVMGSLRGGGLTVIGWKGYRAEREIGNWPLAAPVGVPAAV